MGDASIRFFDTQFRRQIRQAELALNPFEQRALPWLQGRVLDYGCGLGNLALAAGRRGCTVLALDASPAAIEHLQARAAAEALPVQAVLQDLASHHVEGEFDTVVCIGLLMFFDCDTAWRKLRELQDHLRPGGVAVVNVLVEGTTYLAMFDPQAHCLPTAATLLERFAGWEILAADHEDFPAPDGTVKSFSTIIARKPPQPPA